MIYFESYNMPEKEKQNKETIQWKANKKAI